jgi:hypothetical protein
MPNGAENDFDLKSISWTAASKVERKDDHVEASCPHARFIIHMHHTAQRKKTKNEDILSIASQQSAIQKQQTICSRLQRFANIAPVDHVIVDINRLQSGRTR